MMTNKWFTSFNQPTSGSLTLVCFPYAGGSSSIFKPFSHALSGTADVIALQPPGRASRFVDTPIHSMVDLVDAVVEHLGPMLGSDYVLYGHSLGAKVAFEVALKLTDSGFQPPATFIASGCPAPSIKKPHKAIYSLPDDKFLQKLKELGGTPEAVLNNRALMELCMPALRADFQILDDYEGTNKKLDCKAQVMFGSDDQSVSPEHAHQWAEHFSKEVTMHEINGEHFFIEQNVHDVQLVLNRVLGHIQSKYTFNTAAESF